MPIPATADPPTQTGEFYLGTSEDDSGGVDNQENHQTTAARRLRASGYIDCSNLFIEAQKVSALARGWARSLAEVNQQGPIDFGYRLDFHRLMALLRKVEEPVQAAVFGSVTDSNEMLWPHAEAASFEVRVVERSVSGREKRVDTGVVTRICRDAYRLAQPGRDHLTLVAAMATTSRWCGSW